ncbi:MAG: mechanosensitive ion channel family protein, partial [Luminiphilus sp.]
MRWQKISMKLVLALLLGWTTVGSWADVDTDKSVVAASAKIEGEGDLTAAELLARSEEINASYEASVLSGFTPGRAQTPQQALVALYSAFRMGDPESAALYLDLRYVPESLEEVPPVNIARGLLFIFSQQNVLDLTRISSEPEGSLEDGLPEDLEQFGTVSLSDEVIPVYLQRIEEADGTLVWRVSNATVVRTPDMWDELGYSDLNVWLSQVLPEFYVLGMGNFQVAILLATAIGGWFITGWISVLIAGLGGRFSSPWQHALSRFLRVPLRLILYVALIRIVIANLGLSVIAKAYLQSSPLEYLVAVILAFGLLNLYRDYKIRQLELQGDVEYVALIKPVVVIVRIIVATTAALMWADQAGFNVSTLIAGLGVGSLAVALAAQKTLENVIGAITLYTARPIRPGDWCRFGDIQGTVEEIGLRSVTLRTLNRTLVTVPNSMFSSADIENFSVRDRIRFFKLLELQMPTPDQLRAILGEFRTLFASHPMVRQDTVSIRLADIEAATAVIRLDGGIMTRDYQEYLAVAEDLNLRIIEIVHQNGAIFSGPGQVLQIRDFQQAGAEKLQEVEAKLEVWRQGDGLPFPDLSDQEKQQLKGS